MPISLQAKAEAAIAGQEKASTTNHSDTEHLAPADLPSLIRHYGGTLAPSFAEEIRHIDHTLNEEHPAWNSPVRRERSWAKLPLSAIYKVKFLINRRAQIVTGSGMWGLVLAPRGDKPPQVIPIRPTNRARKSNPAAFERVLSIPLLASEAGTSASKVRKILATDEAQDHRGAMVDFVREALAADAPKPAPAPAKDVATKDGAE